MGGWVRFGPWVIAGTGLGASQEGIADTGNSDHLQGEGAEAKSERRWEKLFMEYYSVLLKSITTHGKKNFLIKRVNY